MQHCTMIGKLLLREQKRDMRIIEIQHEPALEGCNELGPGAPHSGESIAPAFALLILRQMRIVARF